MIYCQVLPRLELDHGQPLLLGRMARILGPQAALSLPVSCPDAPGVWRIPAIDAARALQTAFPAEEITLLGADACTIRRLAPVKPDRTKPLRTVLALLVLLMGSTLGMTWFHSDVDMPAAMEQVFTLLTGQPVSNRLLITIPYVIGVAAGTGVFYALGRRQAVTPLDVKFSDYREDMERAEAHDVD